MPQVEQEGRARGSRVIRVGDREVITRGLKSNVWADAYYNAMTIGWVSFVAASAVFFCITNAIFAVLYMLGDQPISNVKPGDFLQYFFFSVETLATVGYGDLHPQSTFGHTVASVEMFVGLFLTALLTGLIFARFARPRARFIFAKLVTVSFHDGKPTLIVRVANARQNMISDATAKLWLVRTRANQEGIVYRAFEELALQRSENPVFVLSWSLFHVIDETSPLAGVSSDQLAIEDASLLLALTGHDESAAQQVYGRQTYPVDQLRWNHRYVDIIDTAPDGRTLIDYSRFHDVVEVAS